MRNKTLKEIIAMADELNPNSYSNNIKAQWVNEVEAYIQTEIYNVAPLDVVSYIDYEESKDKELSLDAVNDKIYLTYLQAMIDFSNKEYQAFNNDVALYNSYLDIYAKWYVRTHGEGEKLISGMYLSAYGIAVKNGFEGTEEEWLLSLKGDKGEQGHGIEIKGVVNNVSKLPDSAEVGDIWLIPVEIEGEPNEWGISEAYQTAELYIWNGTEWQSIGSFKGEQGPQGYPGDKGEKGDKGKPGEDGVGIDNVYTLPYEGGRGVVLQLSNGLTYSFDVNDGKTPVKGVDYWTEEDKAEIVSEIPSGGTWKKLVDITTTEEVNEINVSHEDFPKCKEFIVRAVYQKSATGESVSIGNAYCYLNDNKHTAFRCTTTINGTTVTEQKFHVTIADGLINGIGTKQSTGQAAVVADATAILIGERFINVDVTNIIYRISDNTKAFPIGTKFYIYGKVAE